MFPLAALLTDSSLICPLAVETVSLTCPEFKNGYEYLRVFLINQCVVFAESVQKCKTTNSWCIVYPQITFSQGCSV